MIDPNQNPRFKTVAHTETYRAFAELFEDWSKLQDPDADIRPLRRAAIAHLRISPPIAEIAMPLAVLYFASMDFDGHSRVKDCLGRLLMRVWVCALKSWPFRDRPMWNDFYMALWMLSRDDKYVLQLHKHLTRAREKKIEQQFLTGEWMVNSVSEQNPEFGAAWRSCCATSGEVFG